MRLDPQLVAQQINNLILQYPELADDETLRADMIEGETDAHEFLRQIMRKYLHTKSLLAGMDALFHECQARSQRFERRKDALRDLAMKIMNAADLRKVELPEATLSVRNGTPKVVITDEAIIPNVLCRIVREPDKKQIKELLEAGKEVRGAELSNAEPSLTIRTK